MTNNLFRSKLLTMKIKDIRDANNNLINKNMLFAKKEDILYIPLVRDIDLLFDETKMFFDKYSINFKQIVSPYFLKLRNKFNPTDKKYLSEKVRITELKQIIKKNLPEFKKIPAFKFNGNKNAILNITDFFNFYLPEENFLQPRIRSELKEEIVHKFLNFIILGEYNNFIDKESIEIGEGYNGKDFNNIIISLQVYSTGIELSSTKIIDYKNSLMIKELYDPDNLLLLVLYRSILRFYNNKDEGIGDISFLTKKNIFFIIHNGKQYFTIDFKKLEDKKIKYNAFRNVFRNNLRILMSGNKIESQLTNKEIENKISGMAVNANKKVVLTQNDIDEYVDENDDIEITEDEDDENVYQNIEKDSEITDKNIVEADKTNTIKNKLNDINNSNLPKYSAKQIKRIENAKNKIKEITLDNRSIDTILNDVESKTIDLNESKVDVLDESITKFNTLDFERSYLQKMYKRQILSVVNSFSDSNKTIPHYLIDVSIEDNSDSLTEEEIWTFKFENNKQNRSTMKVKIPKISKEGLMKLNGNYNSVKKQIILLPVVKEDPNTVFVFSNCAKYRIERYGTIINKKFNLLFKLLDKIHSENNDKDIQVNLGNNLDSNIDYQTDIIYDTLSETFHNIIINKKNKIEIYFNQKYLYKIVKEKNIKINENKMFIGFIDNKPIELDISERKPNVIVDLILKYLQENLSNYSKYVEKITVSKKRMYNRITINNKKVPLIIFLSSIYGLETVLEDSNIKYKFLKKIEDRNKDNIKFSDGFLEYDPNDISGALLLNGLSLLDTSKYELSDLNSQEPYIEYYYNLYRSLISYRNILNRAEVFLDPITLEVLKDLKLPTKFTKLFLYASELLVDKNYNKAGDVSGIRIRSYEIIPVILYKNMMTQYSKIKHRANTKIDFTIDPDCIIKGLRDSTISENFYNLNPLSYQKAKNELTLGGTGVGGMSDSNTFTLEKRAYGKNATGVYALSSVDNKKVGITKSLPANANITSTMGYVSPDIDEGKGLSHTQIHNTAESMIPFIGHDSPPRVVFADTQTGHTIPTTGVMPSIVSNGFSKSIVPQLSNTYTIIAEKDGTVEKVTEQSIVIDNKDKTKNFHSLIPNIEKNENFFLEIKLTSNVKEDEIIKKGHVLAYNDDFIKKNSYGELELGQGPIGIFILTEGDETEEDSSLLVDKFAKKMTSTIVKDKSTLIGPKANIISYLKIGDKVKIRDPLISFDFTGEDTTNSGINEILELVKGTADEDKYAELMNQNIKAPMNGTVVDMDVYFTVEIEEMSTSCADFMKYYFSYLNKKLNKIDKSTDKHKLLKSKFEPINPKNGRIKGLTISEEGGIYIQYYISNDVEFLPTDKLSYSSSVKSIVQTILPNEQGPVGLETKTKYDGIIGGISITNRKVTSAYYNGFLGIIIHDMQKRISDEFLKKNK